MFHQPFSCRLQIISYSNSINHGKRFMGTVDVYDTLKYKFYHYVRHVAGRISTDGIKQLA